MNTEITVENTRKQHIIQHMTSDEEHPVAAIVRDVMQREEILWNGSSDMWTLSQHVLVDMLRRAYEEGMRSTVDKGCAAE